jgi:hypothetical protein
MPSSSSTGGDGNNYNNNPIMMTDSNVLRLIRRYDPVGANITGIKTRRSLENAPGAWHTTAPKLLSSLPSSVSSSTHSFLLQRPLISTYEDNGSVKQPSTPRLQRQKAIHQQEPPSFLNVNNSVRPVLKYTPPTSRAQLNVQTKKTEPLTIEIEPHVPQSITINENQYTYQPLITTGTKRVCAAVSKSEWDLRLQHDSPSPTTSIPPSTFPVRPPSPRSTNNQLQEKESYRPLFGRSKSSVGINNSNTEQNDNIDDFDENSAPISAGSCVEKLKQLFTTKSSMDSINTPINKLQNRVDSSDSNLSRRLNTNGTHTNKSDLLSSTSSLIQKVPNLNLIETPTRTIPNGNLTKPTTIIQEAVPTSSPLLKRPILKTQKTFDRYVKIIFRITTIIKVIKKKKKIINISI